MRAFLRPVLTALSIVCLPMAMAAAPIGAALAQQADAPGQAPKQMALADKQIDNVLAAKKEMDAILSKLPEGNDQPDPKTLAQLDAVAKKHGLANYGEYDDVSNNISLVMAGIDPQTKKYVGDEVILKQQIAEVQADKKMPAADKKEALSQLNDALKAVTPLQFPANIQLVSKYYDKLAESAPPNQ